MSEQRVFSLSSPASCVGGTTAAAADDEEREKLLDRAGESVSLMVQKTTIQWCDYTSNPLIARRLSDDKRGWHCVKVSPGCANCYAARINQRLGTGLDFTAHNADKVRLEIHEPELKALLKVRKPGRVFIGDMSDLFQDGVTDEMLDRIFAVMAMTPHLTYQVLTKRPERMKQYILAGRPMCLHENPVGIYALLAGPLHPLPNVWLGVSVEDQQRADERIPILLQIPATVRFLSVEPLLSPVDLSTHLQNLSWRPLGKSDLVIIGGESGPKARPMDITWARSLVAQCREAGVPVFVKQLGHHPYNGTRGQKGFLSLHDPKGGDPAEWPEDLRVRQFPVPEVSICR